MNKSIFVEIFKNRLKKNSKTKKKINNNNLPHSLKNNYQIIILGHVTMGGAFLIFYISDITDLADKQNA